MKTSLCTLSIFFVIVIFQSCKKEIITAVNTSSTNEIISEEHYIGERFGGGFIYWLTPGKKHGLIFDTTRLTGVWWDGSKTKVGRTDSAFGTGNTNTKRIVALLGDTTTYAAKICSDFNGGNYDDWFLPSLDELLLLFEQDTLVETYNLHRSYWTSTENSKAGAWYIVHQWGFPEIGFNRKKGALHIIPVRSF